ncbi:MAG: phage integrase family protein [Halanaerobium sp. T82-1]|jgi:integrase|nr:MAG: phage integrase family protein [Halanaerobium sp. T82-1]
MVTSLKNLKPITYEDNYNKVTIGKSKFSDNTWDLSSFFKNKNIKKSMKKIKFSYIKSDDLRLTIKKYAYYQLGKNNPKTVRDKINSHLPAFIYFCETKKINSFDQVNLKIFLNYLDVLKTQDISDFSSYLYALVVKEIIITGQIKKWNVNNDNFKQFNINEIFNSNKKCNKTKPIPLEIFNQIVNCAVNKENNVLTKSCIIIQSQTGLRISEVLSIKEGCINTTSDGYYYMQVTLSKTEKEPINHKIFVNDLVVETINELEKHTKFRRKVSGLKELFLYSYNDKIRVLKSAKFNYRRLTTFIKRHNIRDKNGDLYPLKTHQFRATYVRELIKKKIPLSFIKKHLGHVSLEMTFHYLNLKKEEIINIYAEMILEPSSKLAGKQAKKIKNILELEFQGKAEEDINNIISNLSKTMSFNPLPTGVCLYDFRRGNCTDGEGCFMYNCPNYLTEISFYPVLKKELDLLIREMDRFKILGRERDYQRRKIKYDHLKPLVEDLENEIELSDLHQFKEQIDQKTYERLEVKISG